MIAQLVLALMEENVPGPAFFTALRREKRTREVLFNPIVHNILNLCTEVGRLRVPYLSRASRDHEPLLPFFSVSAVQ